MIIVMESTEILIMIATAGINDNDNMILILVKTFFPKVQRIGKVGEISYDS